MENPPGDGRPPDTFKMCETRLSLTTAPFFSAHLSDDQQQLRSDLCITRRAMMLRQRNIMMALTMPLPRHTVGLINFHESCPGRWYRWCGFNGAKLHRPTKRIAISADADYIYRIRRTT
jgi:hypothetical protein